MQRDAKQIRAILGAMRKQQRAKLVRGVARDVADDPILIYADKLSEHFDGISLDGALELLALCGLALVAEGI